MSLNSTRPQRFNYQRPEASIKVLSEVKIFEASSIFVVRVIDLPNRYRDSMTAQVYRHVRPECAAGFVGGAETDLAALIEFGRATGGIVRQRDGACCAARPAGNAARERAPDACSFEREAVL